jgi:hypothetical protein
MIFAELILEQAQDPSGLISLAILLCPLTVLFGVLLVLMIWLWKLVRDYNIYKARTEEHMRRVEDGLDRIATLLERNHPKEAGSEGKSGDH